MKKNENCSQMTGGDFDLQARQWLITELMVFKRAVTVSGNNAREIGGPGLLHSFMISGHQFFQSFKR